MDRSSFLLRLLVWPTRQASCHLEGSRLVQAQEGPRHHMRQALRAVLDDFQDRLPSEGIARSVSRSVGMGGGCGGRQAKNEKKKQKKTPKRFNRNILRSI